MYREETADGRQWEDVRGGDERGMSAFNRSWTLDTRRDVYVQRFNSAPQREQKSRRQRLAGGRSPANDSNNCLWEPLDRQRRRYAIRRRSRDGHSEYHRWTPIDRFSGEPNWKVVRHERYSRRSRTSKSVGAIFGGMSERQSECLGDTVGKTVSVFGAQSKNNLRSGSLVCDKHYNENHKSSIFEGEKQW